MHIFRWHPELKPSRHGPLVGRTPSLLRQSDLDGACGHHCVLMALMILDVLKRADLSNLPRARSKSLSHMWRMTSMNYFAGTTASDLQYMLAHYETVIETRIRRRNQIGRVLEILTDSGVAIVGIRNSQLNHWVLAAGVGGLESGGEIEPSRLLILDPGHPQVALTAWNAMLSVKPDRHNRHVYETADNRMQVVIENIITIRRRNPSGR